MMSRLLEKARGDSVRRLRWVVLRALGISPLSFGALFLSKRRVFSIALQMVLDLQDLGGADEENEGFDEGHFRRLLEGDE